MDALKFNVIYEDNHLLVVEKPVNIPTQADNTNDPDMHSLLKEYIKEKYQKPGNVYLGLVHRLDRPVGGLMVFAKTSKCAARLTKQLQTSQFSKTYLAVIDNVITKKEDTYVDKLLKNQDTNMVTVNEAGKEAVLSYKLLAVKDRLSLVEINLQTGRSHQIRVQFASRGNPLYGDQRYNKNAKAKEQIALLAYKLSFNHPTTSERLTFELKTKDNYPWNLFKWHKKDIYI